MQVLISIKSVDEVKEAILGGADIIDLKNPDEGSLGAAAPWNIRYVKDNFSRQKISAAIGDFPYLPNTAALSALGAAYSGADYVKVGLYGAKNIKQALEIMKSVVKAVKSYNQKIIVVGAGYADYYKIESINPLDIPNIVKESHADIAMIDTAIKDGTNLFSHLEENLLELFVDTAHNHGLKAALAGSLSIHDIKFLHRIKTDIIGFRTAICNNNNRKTGMVSKIKVMEIMELVSNLNNNSIDISNIMGLSQ